MNRLNSLGIWARLKSALKPWLPSRALSFYRQFRKPLHLPDRSEVILFADEDTLSDYRPRRDFSINGDDKNVGEPVTLIATVYNEAGNVGRWLDTLQSQRRLPDEIVISDGGSADNTLQILHHYSAKFPVPLRVISAPGANIARGRNLSIEAATHDIVACSDCGSLLDENWLHALTLPFTLDPQVAVSAGYYDVRETNTISHLARTFFGVDLSAINPQKFLPSSRSIAFRKRWWADAGGYPEWLTDAGEDSLFDLRLKAQPGRWAFVPAARVAWNAPDTLWKLLRTYFRYSLGDGETGVSADLYWYKVVELLRLWPRRLAMSLAGFVLAWLWPLAGAAYFGAWLLWSLWRLWRENRPHALVLGRSFYPYTALLEAVGLVQAVAFTVGVLNRPRVRSREVAFYRGRISEILVQHPKRFGVVVYPPTHDWGFMFQRPHQIAREFARQGRLFFYCTNNERTDSVFGFREHEPGLYLSNVPSETYQTLERPVVYLGSAWNRVWLKHFDAPRVIYDHYDDLEVSGARVDDHRFLLRDADVVLVSARRLLESVYPYRKDALLIPNGVDYSFIQEAQPKNGTSPPEDLKPILALGRPIVGYSGALAEWFDYDLLIQAAEKYPAFSFVLIGVDYDGSLKNSNALKFPNIFYLGMKEYRELFNYVWRFEVAIIPFKVNRITQATSPIKLFEYLACRKPVVVTDLPECRDYSDIFLAESNAAFLDFLAQAMEKQTEDYLARIDKLARENTWEARVDRILKQLTESNLDSDL